MILLLAWGVGMGASPSDAPPVVAEDVRVLLIRKLKGQR